MNRSFNRVFNRYNAYINLISVYCINTLWNCFKRLCLFSVKCLIYRNLCKSTSWPQVSYFHCQLKSSSSSSSKIEQIYMKLVQQIKQVFSNFLPYSTNSNSNPNKRIVSPSLAPRSRKALSIPICRNCLAKRFTPSSEEKSVILNSFSTFGPVNSYTSASNF